MDEQSKAALDLLVQNGYLEAVKGKYRATKKLNDQKSVEFPVTTATGTILYGTWEEIYTRFIMECKIPKKAESGTGDEYDLNKYSEDGMKAFRDLIKLGFQYDLLVKVTTAYYHNGTRYKKKIGNFITQGLWRMEYQVLKEQTTEEQQQTLQKLADESKPFTRDRIG